ncbi:hypothetical protein AQI95_00970 [Streptomyces yokosukanensis]|uniref:Uncharacterized protein n=1 Tax=Streptomyces yokosukanensis TaxID=67386 RepID=A0A124HHJ2_9ACTN|nr:hypothetical protein [Streptomyces yokosukanensis]KUN10332.1 hypothetical protein AQI95_00970 [Streptomyces yokosukanensis]
MTTPPPQGQNPFAQGQQAYGQPQAPYPPQGGYPQQPGQPQAPYAQFPNQGAPVPPAPASTGKRMGKRAIRIVGIIVVAVIVGLLKFGAGWFLTRDDAETTSVGSCMHNNGSTAKPDLKEVDCSSSDAQYTVVQKFDGSSDDSKCAAVTGATISYIQYGGGHDVVLCLKDAK